MMKTLRASVSFPAALHRSLKLKVAGADPRVTLTDYVARAVEASSGISDRAIAAARATLTHEETGRTIRSTITFSPKAAYSANNRAIALGLSPSEFIAAVVAHRLNQHGK